MLASICQTMLQRTAGVKALPDIARDELRVGDHRSFKVIVRDSNTEVARGI